LVQRAGEPQDEEDPGDEHGEQSGDLVIAHHGQSAHHPAVHDDEQVRLGEVAHEEDPRGADEGDGHAAQQEGAHRELALASGQTIEQEHDEGGSGEGEDLDSAEWPQAEAETEGHREDRAKSAAGGDSEHVGISEGITEDRLQGRSGHP